MRQQKNPVLLQWNYQEKNISAVFICFHPFFSLILVFKCVSVGSENSSGIDSQHLSAPNPKLRTCALPCASLVAHYNTGSHDRERHRSATETAQNKCWRATFCQPEGAAVIQNLFTTNVLFSAQQNRIRCGPSLGINSCTKKMFFSSCGSLVSQLVSWLVSLLFLLIFCFVYFLCLVINKSTYLFSE